MINRNAINVKQKLEKPVPPVKPSNLDVKRRQLTTTTKILLDEKKKTLSAAALGNTTTNTTTTTTTKKLQHQLQQQQQQPLKETHQITTVTKVIRSEIKHFQPTDTVNPQTVPITTLKSVDGGGGGVSLIDYVAMAYDPTKHHQITSSSSVTSHPTTIGNELPNLDYSQMSMGLGSSQYLYSKINPGGGVGVSLGMDGNIRVPDGAELYTQHAPSHNIQQINEYEQYPQSAGGGSGGYANSIYITKSMIPGGGMRAGSVGPVSVSSAHQQQQQQCSYQNEHNSCNISSSSQQQQQQQQQQIQQAVAASNMNASQQELNISGLPEHHHTLVPTTVRYMPTASYDDMAEYGVTDASNCQVMESHYADDVAAVAYGYVSETNYEMPGVNVGVAGGVAGGSINTNSYSPRTMIYDDNLNNGSVGVGGNGNGGVGINVVGDDGRIGVSYDAHHMAEFQQKMSQLTLNPLDMVSQLRIAKDELINGSGSDICSTMRWRDPNLSEVISFLNNPNNAIKANAAAYLQHLCYMDDTNKQRTRTLGGIPPLIRLLSYDVPEIHKNACGALRNLSYGRQNDENKRTIKNAGGITALVNLLQRTQESEVKELVTGVLWNMSSCEDIKRSIIDDSLNAIVNNIIKPHSGWDPICPGDTCYSTVFRNASGVLRNVSSAGEYARQRLREAEHLVECLIYVIKQAIEKNNIGNKTVENCVCILRNLSYRCQEVEDPNYDKQPMFVPTRATVSSSSKGENLGCFGASKKKKEIAQQEQQQQQQQQQLQLQQQQQQQAAQQQQQQKITNSNGGVIKGYEHLWQPEVVQYYLALLQSCSNPETLEAAAGAIQNLSACFWQPSIDIRATVRKEKGLPILVELLRMEVDRVVCAVATALRNLAIDQRNKELIGKYAMRDLVQKLPSGNPQHDQNTSDDTISAVLATINEVIKKNPEFSRSLQDAGGVERLMNITRQRQKYTTCVLKFASQVLFTMWQHHELRDVYRKNGWKEQDFVQKSFLAQHNAAPNSPNNANNTLNRPMASQGRTKYEDRTIQRVPHNNSNTAARSNGGTTNSGGGGMSSGNGGAGPNLQLNENTSMLYQMSDDNVMNGGMGVGMNEDIYQRGGVVQNANATMYTAISDNRRNNHSTN